MARAGAWVTQYKSDLAARDLGFDADDHLAAITAAAAAHPLPPGGDQPGPADRADMQRVQQAALDAVYPEHGFAPEDPRLSAVGMPLVAYAVAARAIGWAGDHWTPMLKQDMAVATLYGQLFANSGELPRRP